MSNILLQRLSEVVGSDNVITEGLEEYSSDMADFKGRPIAVIRPANEVEVARIVKIAASHKIPIVPRGAGTSLTGASIASDSLMLDMRRMNKIVNVDVYNSYVRAQAGVILDDLNKELAKKGFFFPPDPASSFLCTVGGAVAEGSGGFRCVKYGTMKDWVLAVRVVLSNGEIVQFGEPLAKNRAGYDLTHLVVGSEGTLCIVTEAYLKILPLPSEKIQRVVAQFDDWADASKVIISLKESRIIPVLLEFMDKLTVSAVNSMTNSTYPEAEATLIVDINDHDLPRFLDIAKSNNAIDIHVASSQEEADEIYNMRAFAFLAVKRLATGVQVEDVVVPIHLLFSYLMKVKEVAKRHSLSIPVNGHAGDGNVHPVILYNAEEPKSRMEAQAAFEEICRYAISIGGSITGEHGIGIQKAKLLREQLELHNGIETLRLMKEIKTIFDPLHIFNPGKYVEVS
ncbi:MAG: FAD-binding oxidoreductase [Nitrososphaerota archaeon]